MSRAFGLAVAIAVLIALGFVVSCVYTVSQTQQVALVEFGAPVGIITEPGLHLKSPLQQAYYFDRRLLDLEAANQEIVTLDRRRVMIDAYARWRIVSPLLFKAQPDSNIAADNLKTLLASNMREVLGAQNFTVLLSDRRPGLMRQVKNRMNADARQFGVEIADVRVRHIDLPNEDAEAVYQRMKEDRERLAARNRAEGDLISKRIRARADREATVIKAEALAEAAVLKGQGDAEKTRITAPVFAQDPGFYAFLRSMQAYQETLTGTNTTIVLSPQSDFLKYFGEGAGPSGRKK